MKAKHYKFAGRGQHEVYLPTTGNGQKGRRDRKKCKYYHADTQFCSKIWNCCVGPVACKKFEEKQLNEEHKYAVGTTVYSQHYGEGKIVTISRDICTIQFASGEKVTAKYPDVFRKKLFLTEPSK